MSSCAFESIFVFSAMPPSWLDSQVYFLSLEDRFDFTLLQYDASTDSNFVFLMELQQLRKPVSTLSIPGAMKSIDRTRDDEGALVGVQAEYPSFEKRKAASLAAAAGKEV